MYIVAIVSTKISSADKKLESLHFYMCVHHTVQKFHSKRDKIYTCIVNESFDPDKEEKMTELIDSDSAVKIAAVISNRIILFSHYLCCFRK